MPTFFFLLLGGIIFLAVAAFARDTILPGEGIYGNQTLISKNGVFEMGFFSPGPDIYHFLGVRLKNIAGATTFWFGDRVYITDLPSAALELFGDRLYIREAGANLWWSSVPGNGSGSPPAAVVAVLLDSGNLVVRDQANSSRILWQSFDCPGDTLLPGGRLGFDRDTGKNISLTYTNSWHNGSLTVDQSRRNGFVLTTDAGEAVTPGTFPDWMVSSQENGSSLVLNYPRRPDFTEHLQLHLGQVSLRRWSKSISSWVVRWTFPSDCKSGAFFCGRFGACTNNSNCDCIDGFEPSKPSEWQLGYFVNGCSRSLPLSCEINSGQTEHDDSFVPLDKLQGLPYNSQNDSAGSDRDCREACVSLCYCVAYVYDDSGCKLWYHSLYNVSLGTRPPYSKVYVRLGSKVIRVQKGLHTIGIVFLVVGLTAATCVILILALLWRYRRGLFTFRKFQVEGPLAVYPYGQVKRATRNFSDKLGEGGFGCVFRGTMPGSTVVAVKRLKGLGRADKQFRAEVQTLGVIQHTNLVRLLGFCVKGHSTRLLVYEYMPNGSLGSHLFSEDSGLQTWDLRYRIALGIAKGLAYLHEECEDCIIHCDIKPENILLDAEFCPKIADFGMAKLLGREFNSALTTIRGTMGYLAPEWVSGQRITKKADVYSFGIVLLEIISGRRTTKRLKFGSHRYFPLFAAAQLNEGNVLCLLDHKLEGNANVKELDVACRVACWCIQDEESDRPSMGQVVRMLEGVLSTEIPPVPSSFMDLIDGENSGTYSEES
ncbi:G-type lectin S-receptor-like serine/threonine-protein kinase [Dichanthelium oligosanthes]|uniref:Receptor-like serine/threonine-protein kinase n=1 Tax=Dichanthelium oligosanthes TaxID=888268 RepID=A0A1E5WFT2_9POAL|nr:G-type lectin S-receptor-like serine/threonine-protein kinase [Dichanthelium oligosanthes]